MHYAEPRPSKPAWPRIHWLRGRTEMIERRSSNLIMIGNNWTIDRSCCRQLRFKHRLHPDSNHCIHLLEEIWIFLAILIGFIQLPSPELGQIKIEAMAAAAAATTLTASALSSWRSWKLRGLLPVQKLHLLPPQASDGSQKSSISRLLR